MKKLIRKRLKESFNMELVESLLDEDYPTNFDREVFKTLRSFKERVKYCEENLQRISSGSGRIVYKIDNERVLKLAKNEKGAAQCEVEIQWGSEKYYSDILAHTFDYHQDGFWVEMELARKVNKNTFIKTFGFSVDTLGMYLRNFEEENKGKRRIFDIDKGVESILDESEFVNQIRSFMMDSDSGAGDLGKLSTYGLVTREGSDSIVLIDFGLTNNIYSNYYS